MAATTARSRMEGMTSREQAALLAGFAVGMNAERAKIKMSKAFHAAVEKHARTAMEILQGGAFNPISAMEFQTFMEENFRAPGV